MNVPAIAQKTFNESSSNAELLELVLTTFEELRKIDSPHKRAEYIHGLIEHYNQEIFAHPLVQKLSPCKLGCSACCHTQVSVTQDEAVVLSDLIKDGMTVDRSLLDKQMTAKSSETEFYKLSFQDRKCIFLDDNGACSIYQKRPSVCRTNAVIGDPLQCDSTSKPGQMTLVRTPKADLVVYAFYLFSSGGVLPDMVGKELNLTVVE